MKQKSEFNYYFCRACNEPVQYYFSNSIYDCEPHCRECKENISRVCRGKKKIGR